MYILLYMPNAYTTIKNQSSHIVISLEFTMIVVSNLTLSTHVFILVINLLFMINMIIFNNHLYMYLFSNFGF
jgi:hypothetical protein